MRFKSRTWSVISLLLFAAAWWFWNYGEKINAARRARAAATQSAAAQPAAPVAAKVTPAVNARPAKSYRLSNSRLTEKQLIRSNHAIILRNALIDTDLPLKLGIPAHLRAKGAPGSYIVQSDEPVGIFQDRLKKDGVEYVSYIPNNAALVLATPDQAKALAADAEFQAVLPYEPYYKLATPLLPEAVAQDQPQSAALNVTTFPGQRNAALAALQALGAQLMGEDTGPFGTTLTVMAPPDKLVAIAQLPLAQEIEPYAPRRALNDLTRVALGISSNTLYTTPNYLSLTGSNVTVNMNDTGVDTNHPDFGGPNGTIRLTGLPVAPYDYSGHGTHVAGIIMGNGSKSSAVSNAVPGSIIRAGFQGKATNATLFVQSLGLVVGATIADAFQVGGSLVSDAVLQNTASSNLGPTNLISNNSWGYNGVTSYDMHAASYDQATRDAQPMTKGEQPLLFVFAAGGGGNGDNFGENGAEGSIVSPATAKNVITVGAIDSPRYITNGVTYDDVSTNEIFFPWTDNDDLVAWFSSCGNVGAGTEGLFGRFKPDVVAPGVFTISCRATNYVDPTNAAYITAFPFPGQSIIPGQTNGYPLYIPPDTEFLVTVITPNAQSPVPFPNLDILADDFNPPTDVLSTSNYLALSNQLKSAEWYFGVMTQTNQIQPVSYDLTFYLVETNDLGVGDTNASGYFSVISNLNSVLKPYYVYQYGTSMSAGAVSGMLALMQEFLQTKAGITNPTPALLKAMLINGSRSLEQQYDFNPQPQGPNEQGWGLPNLPNSLPASLTNGASTNVSVALINQSTNDALATGQSQSYTITCTDTNATNFAVRVTLVWTDPPGDPVAGIALVNNLDLLVTDNTGTNIWLGNDFYAGDIFTEVNTGDFPDLINNVQNVYIDSTNSFFEFPLTVTVLGMRVNVNAATMQTNRIAQDYALVISTDDTNLTKPLTISATNGPTFTPPPNLALLTDLSDSATNGPLLSAPLMALAEMVGSNYALVTIASNATPLLHQRAGANEPNLYANGVLYTNVPTDTNGSLVQWHFFVFTNSQFLTTNLATNVAFTTFMPPDLATQIDPRTNGADLDMYVSTNSGLTNLDPAAFATMTTNDMSLSQGGTETVIYTNSFTNEVYYIGIKSEDQQAVDFGFYGVAQQAPFSSVNPDGSVTATATGIPVVIPDSPGLPAYVFAFLFDPENPSMHLRNVTATLGIEHGNPSDLYGMLQHDQTQDVLNNYSGSTSGFTNSYNDLDDNTLPGSVNSDGPGSLKNYVSGAGQGVWILTEADNAVLQAGEVSSFSITGYPQPIGLGFTITLCGQEWYDDYVVVPNDATNMTISVTYVSGDGPVGIFMTNVDDVGFSSYGVEPINPPGGYLSYGITNVPPLAGGTWYFGIYDYNSATNDCVTLNVQINFQLSQVPNLVQTFTNTTPVPLPVDATTNGSQICISAGQSVVDLNVGVRVADSNLDDLVLQLTSPQGTSIVLFQNRGGVLASNLGFTVSNSVSTNYVFTTFTDDTNLSTNLIKFAPPPYATNIYNPLTVIESNSFDYFTNAMDLYTSGGVVSSNAAGNYTNGQTVAGWFVETNLLEVVNVLTNQVTGPSTNQVTNEYYIQVTNEVYNEVSVVTGSNVTALGTNSLGSNFLALASGRLSQTFATVPGVAYELRYYARSPGIIDWWPADDNTVDIVGTNNGTMPNNATNDVTFDVGEVARAFTFNGVGPSNNDTGNEVDFGTNTGNFGTNDFTIDFWIKMPPSATGLYGVLEKRTICQGTLPYLDIHIGPERPGLPTTTPGRFFVDCAGNGNDFSLLIDTNSTPINDGLFHHAAVVRNGLTLAIYVDGILGASLTNTGIADIDNTNMFRAGQSVCVSPGIGGEDSSQPFIGDLDELDLWQRALSPAEIHAIYQAGSLGKYNTNSLYPNFDVAFDYLATNDVIITNFAGGWQAYTNSFIAASNQTTVELLGNTLGVLLDDIEMVQLPYTNYNNYFLPEEPLTPFIGQNPQGCWTLSVWDTRADSTQPVNGALLGWTLQLTTSSTNVNLIVLSNGVPFTTNNLPPAGIVYFGVDVPATANFATNILTGNGPMNLYFNQDALPTGGLPGDLNLLNLGVAGGTGSDTLSTQGAPPPLIPGQRYFLGVQNTGSGTESFTLQVNFDVGANTGITPLTNGIALDPTIGTNGPQFYSFLVPTNSAMVTFQLLSMSNGEANLYAREGLPVPSPTRFDYDSLNQATNDQFIVVTTNSEPVPLPTAGTNDVLPLAPQTWYLSVYNPGTNTVSYTILATWATNTSNTIVGAMNIISLDSHRASTNATSYIYTYTNPPVAQGYPSNLLYSFTITNLNASGVQFTVTNLTTNGNVELLVGRGVFPTPQDFYIGSFNSGPSNQFVSIVTNVTLLSLSNTIWYAAVPNTSTSGSNVGYSISAAVLTNATVTSQPLLVAASVSSPGGAFSMSFSSVPGASYQIQVSSNLTSWAAVTNITASSSTTTYTDAVPANSQKSRYFRIVTP